jgi:ribosome recycling factor
MQLQSINQDITSKLKEVVSRFGDELKKVRTGRAHPSMLENVMAEAYGTPMPLIQLATITTPEPQLLQLSPFDPNNIDAIVTAIRNDQSLGLNPSDDGRIVRVSIPSLTEERRREISKQVGVKLEESMIAMRSVRHEALGVIDQSKKDKFIGEDEAKRLSTQIEDAISGCKQDLERLASDKESEIMTV